MKHVLFLAPSYSYVDTVIHNLAKDLTSHDIEYWARGTNKKPIFFTKDVNVMFIIDDPSKWRFDGYKYDEIFGKKELIEAFIRLWPGRIVNSNKKMSLARYIISQSSSERNKDIITPFPNGTYIPDIKNVYFNYPTTVVIWADGTKTIVKCQEGDFYDNQVGLAMAISKKALGNCGNYYNTFKKFLPEEEFEELANDELLQKE